MTPVFHEKFYKARQTTDVAVAAYREALMDALTDCKSDTERDHLLRLEAIEITRQITDGIRDLIKGNRNVRDLVLNQGAVPLATWAESLDKMAELSIPMLKQRIAQMQRELEHGRVSGFPGTLLLYDKPSFTTLLKFYDTVFELAEALT